MDHEFHGLLTKLAILEGRIEDSGKKTVPNAERKETPALFTMFDRKQSVDEGHRVIRSIDRERYTDLSDEGLEGPFNFNGRALYYDPREGKYYDRDTDMYLDAEESDRIHSMLGEAKIKEEASEDILSKVKNSLVDYLKNAEDSIKQDKDLLKKKKQDLDLKKKELKDLELQDKKKKELDEGADDIQVGDEVIVTYRNEHQGKRGEVVDLGRSGAFVIVDIDGDIVSMHSSDVRVIDGRDDDDDEELDEDPAQQDPGPDAAVTSLNPTYEGADLPFVESFMLDEVTECAINGDDEHGYEITRGSRRLPTRFDDLDHARMALQMFKNRRDANAEQDETADYLEEK